MHKKFDNREIEAKWRMKWEEDAMYDVGARDDSKEKEYVLVEWPYPSGNLHVGHWYAFAVPDIYVRFLRMQGKQVLYPMGFDAFGLPAENAAIKRGLDPKKWTNDNITYMKDQLSSMGCSFAWDKTTSSTDPDYYKWTQWMFTKFFENGIAYHGKGTVNWCPGCNTVIANEQIVDGDKCERSGDTVEKREMPQWMLKITDYADRLIDDLNDLDWPEHIKEAQRQWIGRSEGAELTFKLSTGDDLNVFTTRPDTLYGATYMVLAPEHPLLRGLTPKLENRDEVEAYIEAAKKKADQDRLDATKEKTGVKLEGITATNPGNGEEIPVFIADYVLASYGTGAIMAVPAHDERDHAFAEKYSIPITQVIRKVFGEPLPNPEPRTAAGAIVYDPKSDKYLVQYSHEFEEYSSIFGGLEDGESFADAAIRETLEETGYETKFSKYITDETEAHFYHPGKKVNRSLVSRRVLLHLVSADQKEVSEEELEKQKPVWLTKAELIEKLEKVEGDGYAIEQLFDPRPYTGVGTLCNSAEFDGMDSEEAKKAITEKVGGTMTNTYRLRDWSVGRQRYWGVPIPIVYDPEGNPHPVKEEHLPWLLPEDVDPTPTGVPPLAKSEQLKKRTNELYGEGWTPEVETLDTFVDSSWYFLRYIDNTNDDSLASKEAQEAWMPIDIYFGGAEHTTMHLLYSRFWQKALFDLGLVTDSEPYKRRINRGLILGPDGNKMSKSKGNVIDPDEQVERVGADSVKMYLAFMGPYEGSNYPWDMGGIAGIRRFLERVYGLSEHIAETEPNEVTKQLHKTILKIEQDVTEFKFNTAISAMMIFVNHAEKRGLTEDSYHTFLRVLAPFAPYLAEELWHTAGKEGSVHTQTWPIADTALAQDSEVTIGVQVNGKLRGSITLAADTPEHRAVATAQDDEQISKYLNEDAITKTIYVPGKILNFIVSND